MTHSAAAQHNHRLLCRCCGLIIILGGDYVDQIAQEAGYLNADHQRVYQAMKAADYKRASR